MNPDAEMVERLDAMKRLNIQMSRALVNVEERRFAMDERIAELERDLAAARAEARRWEACFREAERLVDEHCYGERP